MRLLTSEICFGDARPSKQAKSKVLSLGGWRGGPKKLTRGNGGMAGILPKPETADDLTYADQYMKES